MLEKENSLPRAELHSSIHNWNSFACPGQDHPDMRRHIVGAFCVVFEIIGILRDQPIEEFLEVASRCRIRILHHDQTATRVPRKDRYRAIFNFAFAYDRLDFIGELVSALARCGNGETFRHNVHLAISQASYRSRMTNAV
jgi:hypothetical protein